MEGPAIAAGADSMITVVDVRRFDKILIGAGRMANSRAHFLALLPGGSLFGDGSFGATVAIHSPVQ